MQAALLFVDYWQWHYSRGIYNLITVWTNLLWFLSYYFSLSLLLSTLFSPFHRIQEEYDKSSFEGFFGPLVANIMSRLIGFVIRFFIIVVGVIALVGWFAVLFLALFVWVFAPAVLPSLFLYGLVVLV